MVRNCENIKKMVINLIFPFKISNILSLQEMDLSVGTYIIDNTKKMEGWTDAIHSSLPAGRTHFNVVSYLEKIENFARNHKNLSELIKKLCSKTFFSNLPLEISHKF